MTTPVSICSAALALLGDKPIANFTENTDRAKLCANLYPSARADILREHPWSCAKKRLILSPLTEAPTHDWLYRFNLPPDFLRVLNVGYRDDEFEYLIEGRTLLANTNVLPLLYIFDVNESQWDSHLVHVMIKRMQLELAYPITKSTSLRDSLKQEFYGKGVGVLAKAKTINGQEIPPEEWNDSPFINARAGRRF